MQTRDILSHLIGFDTVSHRPNMALMEFVRDLLAGAGIALGAWGAAQATAQGLSIFFGGSLRDLVGHLATHGWLGAGLNSPSIGYSFVYHLEIGLLFATLAALGPLVRLRPLHDLNHATSGDARLRLAEFPT